MAVFNTLGLAKELEAAGMVRPLAQRSAELLHDEVLANVASKADLASLEQRLDLKFGALDSRFAEARTEIAQLELRLTVRVGAMFIAAVGVLVALDRLMK